MERRKGRKWKRCEQLFQGDPVTPQKCYGAHIYHILLRRFSEHIQEMVLLHPVHAASGYGYLPSPPQSTMPPGPLPDTILQKMSSGSSDVIMANIY